MPKYKIAYYEDNAYLKIFKAKTKEDALKKAYKELSDNGWDTANWEIGLDFVEEVNNE
jgi:hypothetical protein